MNPQASEGINKEADTLWELVWGGVFNGREILCQDIEHGDDLFKDLLVGLLVVRSPGTSLCL